MHIHGYIHAHIHVHNIHVYVYSALTKTIKKDSLYVNYRFSQRGSGQSTTGAAWTAGHAGQTVGVGRRGRDYHGNH